MVFINTCPCIIYCKHLAQISSEHPLSLCLHVRFLSFCRGLCPCREYANQDAWLLHGFYECRWLFPLWPTLERLGHHQGQGCGGHRESSKGLCCHSRVTSHWFEWTKHGCFARHRQTASGVSSAFWLSDSHVQWRHAKAFHLHGQSGCKAVQVHVHRRPPRHQLRHQVPKRNPSFPIPLAEHHGLGLLLLWDYSQRCQKEIQSKAKDSSRRRLCIHQRWRTSKQHPQ